MLGCHSSDQFKSSAVHWGLAELPAGLKGLQFILRSYFIISWINRNYRVKFHAGANPPSGRWWRHCWCWCWVWQYESQPEQSPSRAQPIVRKLMVVTLQNINLSSNTRAAQYTNSTAGTDIPAFTTAIFTLTFCLLDWLCVQITGGLQSAHWRKEISTLGWLMFAQPCQGVSLPRLSV